MAVARRSNWTLTILFNIVLPLFTYFTLVGNGVSEVPALLISGAWPVLEMGISLAVNRHLDEFAIISIIFIALGVVAGLGFNNARLVLVKESVVTGLFGVVTLGVARAAASADVLLRTQVRHGRLGGGRGRLERAVAVPDVPAHAARHHDRLGCGVRGRGGRPHRADLHPVDRHHGRRVRHRPVGRPRRPDHVDDLVRPPSARPLPVGGRARPTRRPWRRPRPPRADLRVVGRVRRTRPTTWGTRQLAVQDTVGAALVLFQDPRNPNVGLPPAPGCRCS